MSTYPFAHFDIYLPEFRELVVQGQIEFLRKNLIETKNTQVTEVRRRQSRDWQMPLYRDSRRRMI